MEVLKNILPALGLSLAALVPSIGYSASSVELRSGISFERDNIKNVVTNINRVDTNTVIPLYIETRNSNILIGETATIAKTTIVSRSTNRTHTSAAIEGHTNDNVVIGNDATSAGKNSVLIGTGVKTFGSNVGSANGQVAIGHEAIAAGTYSISIGRQAYTESNSGIAIGSNSIGGSANSVAIGQGAVAN